MEVDWGGKLKLNYTSCGCMLMEVDRGSKLIVNSMVDWGTHETHPSGHNTSEVDWGGHDCSSNHMNVFLLSELDWGAHDSSFFPFLVNIDYDANPMEFFTQGLWRELQLIMSSTPPIQYMTDSLDTGQNEDDAFSPKPTDRLTTYWRVYPALSLLGRSTTMGSYSGETCHPLTSYYLAQVQVNSKKAIKDLWLCQKVD